MWHWGEVETLAAARADQATQRFCFFFCLHTHTHTRTHVLVKSITHSGRNTMPLNVPRGLVTRSSVLHALCDMSSTRRTRPIVCAWIGGGGGCVCERESWKHLECGCRQLLTQFWSDSELTMVQHGIIACTSVCVRKMRVMDHWSLTKPLNLLSLPARAAPSLIIYNLTIVSMSAWWGWVLIWLWAPRGLSERPSPLSS